MLMQPQPSEKPWYNPKQTGQTDFQQQISPNNTDVLIECDLKWFQQNLIMCQRTGEECGNELKGCEETVCNTNKSKYLDQKMSKPVTQYHQAYHVAELIGDLRFSADRCISLHPMQVCKPRNIKVPGKTWRKDELKDMQRLVFHPQFSLVTLWATFTVTVSDPLIPMSKFNLSGNQN
jgi:hypothetical protein